LRGEDGSRGENATRRITRMVAGCILTGSRDLKWKSRMKA
jgi:hypothetical protein